MRILNGMLLTIEHGRFENGYVDFEDGVITGFGDLAQAPPIAARCWMPREAGSCPA